MVLYFPGARLFTRAGVCSLGVARTLGFFFFSRERERRWLHGERFGGGFMGGLIVKITRVFYNACPLVVPFEDSTRAGGVLMG